LKSLQSKFILAPCGINHLGIFPLKTPSQWVALLSLHAQMPPPKPEAGPLSKPLARAATPPPCPSGSRCSTRPPARGGLRSGDWPAPRPALGSLCGPLRTVKCLRGNRHQRRRHDPLGAKNDPIWSAIAYTSARAYCAAFPGTSHQSLGCNAGAPTADLSKQPTSGQPDDGVPS
jgi:hypothetical protein